MRIRKEKGKAKTTTIWGSIHVLNKCMSFGRKKNYLRTKKKVHFDTTRENTLIFSGQSNKMKRSRRNSRKFPCTNIIITWRKILCVGHFSFNRQNHHKCCQIHKHFQFILYLLELWWLTQYNLINSFHVIFIIIRDNGAMIMHIYLQRKATQSSQL